MQDNDPRKMYYANCSPRQTLFSRGARSRRGEKRCQRTLFFVEIEARRQRIIARKGEFIIDDAQNRRKISRDKQAREAERIETGRETYALIFSYEQREWKTCNCQFFPPPLLRENAFVPAQLISQGSRETPGMEEKSHNSSGWFGVERGEEALIRRNGTSLLRLVLHLLSTGVIGQDKVSLSRETINHPSGVLFICTNIASSHHPTVHLGCDTESGR